MNRNVFLTAPYGLKQNVEKAQTTLDRFLLNPSLFFAICAITTAFITIFFVGFIFYIALPTFQSQGIINFLTGSTWSYEENVYGIRVFIGGTILLTLTTLLMAVPLSVFTAIYLAELASPKTVSIMRPLIELLVGIPSVVYGIVGLFILADFFRYYIEPLTVSTLGFIPLFQDNTLNSGSGLALASTVLAIMILPTIVSISEDSMRAVKREYREAAFALGSTKWETISKVVMPSAFKGIMAGVILGMMRAMGETMAIVMLLGNVQKIPSSFFSYGYAMTSKILNEIGFYVAFEEPRSALFAIAAVLFALEIIFVGVARKIGGKA